MKTRGKKKPLQKTRRRSTSGKINVPLDVTSDSDLPALLKTLKSKKITIVLIYATWCHHCHKLMPHFDAASKNTKNKVASVKINETMNNKVNEYIKNNINSSATPFDPKVYTSMFAVKNGIIQTEIQPIKDTKKLSMAMESISEPPEEVVNNVSKTLTNLGIENKGLVNKHELNIAASSAPSPLNESYNPTPRKSMDLTQVDKEAKELMNLQAQIPSISVVNPPSPKKSYSIDNMKGGKMCGSLMGGSQGGSLMGAMSAIAKSSYTLAPTAALLATAAGMKTHTRNKRHRKR